MEENRETALSRWFKVTFWSPSWTSLSLLKGHLTIPKRSQRIARMLQFASFDPSTLEKLQVWSQRFEYPNLNSSSVIFQSSTSKFAENSKKKTDRQDRPKITPPKKKNLSIFFFARKRNQTLVRGFLLGLGPIRSLMGFVKPIHHRGHLKSRMLSHQGATFKPQHSSHWLHHNSWQSSYHGFLTAKRKVQKKPWTTPKKRGQICEKLGSLRHV